MRASAAANALTGHIDEAQKIMTRMRQLDPAMRVSNLEANLSYRRAEDIGRMIDGLRLAGLPD
jgi:hypothetical protein